MKKFLIRFFIYLTFFSIWSFYRLEGFNVSKIEADLNTQEVVPTGDITQMLNQEFYYLAKGHQCFAFVSEDQRYVIKLINQRRFDLPWFVRPLMIFPYIKELNYSRFVRKKPSYESYQIAYKHLKDETKILYIQIGLKKRLQHFIKIKDKTKHEHKIDLCKVEFVLQERVEPIYEYLNRIYNESGSKFQKAIASFLDIVAARIHKNIKDDDLDIQINYGFLKDQAVLIDPGRLTIDYQLQDFSNQKIEMIKSTKKLREWINFNYPEMVFFFDKTLLAKINSN
jgi:hypothetical protein